MQSSANAAAQGSNKKATGSIMLPTSLSLTYASYLPGCKVAASPPGTAATFQGEIREQPGGGSIAYYIREAKLSQLTLVSFAHVVLA